MRSMTYGMRGEGLEVIEKAGLGSGSKFSLCHACRSLVGTVTLTRCCNDREMENTKQNRVKKMSVVRNSKAHNNRIIQEDKKLKRASDRGCNAYPGSGEMKGEMIRLESV